jgi:hypothetical protein
LAETKKNERLTIPRAAKKAKESAHLTWRSIGLVYRSWPAATLVLGTLTVAVSALPVGVAYAGKGIVDAGHER